MVEFLFKKNVVHAYPNGWTCTNCGTEFSEKTINVECLYVVNTSVGTLCLECHNKDYQLRKKDWLRWQML